MWNRRCLLPFAIILMIISALSNCASVKAAIISNSIQIEDAGDIRVHYDESVSSNCDSVVMIGVGTAMSIADYDLVSKEIVSGHEVVAIIIDHYPGSLFKEGGPKYAQLVNTVAETLSDLVPVCSEPPRRGFMVGGHSASGQAAIDALPLLSFTPAGFIGLDPFKISKTEMHIAIPAFFWGFSHTSCLVTVEDAARGAYEISDPAVGRAFYQIQNKGGIYAKPTHCIFTDEGCPGHCPADPEFAWVRSAVGDTINKFIVAVYSRDFDKNQFQIDYKEVRLFVNNDRVDDPSTRPFSGMRAANA